MSQKFPDNAELIRIKSRLFQKIDKLDEFITMLESKRQPSKRYRAAIDSYQKLLKIVLDLIRVQKTYGLEANEEAEENLASLMKRVERISEERNDAMTQLMDIEKYDDGHQTWG